MYCVVIGDIVGSKKLLSREQVQLDLLNVLQNVNKIYEKEVVSDFSISLGDEFQGVLRDVQSLLAIIRYIKFKMYPVKIRFGVGIGEITTEINRHQPTKVDGPAFYCARATINKLKAQEKKYAVPYQDINIKEYNKESQCLELVNASLALCLVIEGSWTDKQRQIIQLNNIKDSSQTTVAQKLNISKSSVSQTLRAANYENYKYASEKVVDALNSFWENINE